MVKKFRFNYGLLCDYKNTYDFLFKSIETSNSQYDSMMAPMLFLLRHSVELGLKFNLKYLSLATERELNVNIFREHNLKKLSKELKSLFDDSKIADPILIKQINGYLIIVESLTGFITDLDKNGTSFRYDVHMKSLKKEGMIRVNILKLNDLFDQTFDFLLNTSNVLDDYYRLGKPFVDEQLKIDLRKGLLKN